MVFKLFNISLHTLHPRYFSNLLLFCLIFGFEAHALAPKVTQVSAVAPDVIALTVVTGQVTQAKQIPYQKQWGDQIVQKSGPHRWLQRRGQIIGALVGKDDKTFFGFDQFHGEALDTKWADNPNNYRIRSKEDNNFSKAPFPIKVFRKSRPTDMAQTGIWSFGWPMEHKIYLQLPKAMKARTQYEVFFRYKKLPTQTYPHFTNFVVSEAVHVSHLGFRQDDPVKVAFLSVWRGDGGGQTYDPNTHFNLIDRDAKKIVKRAKIKLSRAKGEPEDPYNRNYNKTDVYLLDFSDINQAGNYRVCVEGVGCSLDFSIHNQAWSDAFKVSVRGLFHQRSGIELGPPFTTYRRPRNMHPDDGVKIFASDVPLMDTGNGLNARGKDQGNFYLLNANRTSEKVAQAWGGYADAGDWDRRIQHLRASRLLLELAELYPQFYSQLNLNIPESSNHIADIVDEALWGIDVYRRLQTPEGSVRGGIESEEHTRYGEGSWQESLTIMAYKPGMWSSYLYAAAAAKAAHYLEKRDKNRSIIYRDSALKAMHWAESQYKYHNYKQLPHQVKDARNLAAIELFRVTNDKRWNRVFEETTAYKNDWITLAEWNKYDQSDAAFSYLRTQTSNKRLHASVKKVLLNTANKMVKQGERTGFRWTKNNPYAWLGWGALSVPQAVDLVRAHYITGDERYLKTILFTAQFGAGANPNNMVFTTGLGHKSPQNPLHRDHRVSNQKAPHGITINGPHDIEQAKEQWTVKLFEKEIHPSYAQWPTTESFLDIYSFEPITEFTVHSTIALNAYVWGYLAAR